MKLQDNSVAPNSIAVSRTINLGSIPGLVHNSAGLVAKYRRQGEALQNIALVNLLAVNSAWASGGFKEIDAAFPGVYRLDLPNAMFEVGAEYVDLYVSYTDADGNVFYTYEQFNFSSPSGHGLSPVLVTVRRASDDSAIENITVSLRTGDLSEVIAYGVTNALGQVSFNVDPGNYALQVQSTAGFNPEAPFELDVGLGFTVYEIELTEVEPGEPLDINLCLIRARVINTDGTNNTGCTFKFTLQSTGTLEVLPEAQATFILKSEHTKATVDGIMEQNVLRSDFIQAYNDSSTQWRIECGSLGIDQTLTLDFGFLDLGDFLMPPP